MFRYILTVGKVSDQEMSINEFTKIEKVSLKTTYLSGKVSGMSDHGSGLNTSGWQQKPPVDPASVAFKVVLTCFSYTSSVLQEIGWWVFEHAEQLAPIWGKSWP